jgi:hypothetical protein
MKSAPRPVFQRGPWQALNAVQSPASIAAVGTIDSVSDSV